MLAKNAVEHGRRRKLGEVEPRAGLEVGHRVLRDRGGLRRTSRSSASTPSDTAVPPASATRGRSRAISRIAEGDLVTVRSSPETATRGASTSSKGELPRQRRSSSLMHSPDEWTRSRYRAPRRRVERRGRYLSDICPTLEEVQRNVWSRSTRKCSSCATYADVFTGDETWRTPPVPRLSLASTRLFLRRAPPTVLRRDPAELCRSSRTSSARDTSSRSATR